MKRITYIIICIGVTMMFTSCSKTWSGVKQDTSHAWHGTKKFIHDETA